jgi:CHAT domain-containing protein/Tfp pilus assembly protein PilF
MARNWKSFPVGLALVCLLPWSERAAAAWLDQDRDSITGYTQALKLYGAAQPEAAIKSLEGIIQQDPSFHRATEKLITIYKEQQNLAGARAYFQSWLARGPQNPYAAYGLGLVAKEERQFDQALEQFKACIRSSPEFAPAYTSLCNLLWQLQRLPEATAFIEEVLAAHPDTAAALYGLGYLALVQSQWEHALTRLDRAIQVRPQFWEAHQGKIAVYTRTSRNQEAIEVCQQLLEWAEQTGDVERRAQMLALLGHFFRILGSYPQAIHSLKQASQIAHELSDRLAEERYLGNLGAVYYNLGHYSQAQAACEQALDLAQAVGARSDGGRLRGMLGRIYQELGNISQAETSFKEAITIAQETKDRGSEGAYRADLGVLAAESGNCEAALIEFKQALDIVRQIGPKAAEAERLILIGRCQLRLGHYSDARETYHQALPIARQARVRQVEAECWNGLGESHVLLNDTAPAADEYQKALQIGMEIGSPSILWVAHSGLATVYQRQARLDEAFNHYRLAVAEIEKVRGGIGLTEERAGFLQDKIEVYKNVIGLLVALHEADPTKGHEAEALRTSERARARSLLELLAEAGIEVEPGIGPEWKERERTAHARLSRIQSQLVQAHTQALPDKTKLTQLEADLKQVDREREQLERDIRQKHPRYAELQYPQPLGIDEIRELLDEHTALLEYALGKDGSFLFVVTRDSLHTYRLPSADEITRLVREARAGLEQEGRRAFGQYAEAARQLYEILIAPAADVLANKQHLLIAPDGALYYLPFEALLTQRDRIPTRVVYNRLSYLVNKWTVSYVPSASVLASLRQRTSKAEPQTTGKTFLAFADPVYGEEDLGRQTQDPRPQTQDQDDKNQRSLANHQAQRTTHNRPRTFLSRLWKGFRGIFWPRGKTHQPTSQTSDQTNPQSAIGNPQSENRQSAIGNPQSRDPKSQINPVVERWRSLFDKGGRWSLRRLGYSGREVANIAKLYRPGNVALHLRAEATEETVKGSADVRAARRIHFATHGLVDEELPQFSGLVLTLDDDLQEDGLLQVHEVFNLRLNAELVVLSACETGLGKLVGGEGMIGLTRAFMYAGAPSLVVSLWNVNDSRTASFMVKFYEYLDQAKNKADALRQAKLDMLNAGQGLAHPSSWAPFILIGEAR